MVRLHSYEVFLTLLAHRSLAKTLAFSGYIVYPYVPKTLKIKQFLTHPVHLYHVQNLHIDRIWSTSSAIRLVVAEWQLRTAARSAPHQLRQLGWQVLREKATLRRIKQVSRDKVSRHFRAIHHFFLAFQSYALVAIQLGKAIMR